MNQRFKGTVVNQLGLKGTIVNHRFKGYPCESKV